MRQRFNSDQSVKEFFSHNAPVRAESNLLHIFSRKVTGNGNGVKVDDAEGRITLLEKSDEGSKNAEKTHEKVIDVLSSAMSGFVYMHTGSAGCLY